MLKLFISMKDLFRSELDQYFDDHFYIDGILLQKHYSFTVPDDFSLDCDSELSWGSSSEDGELDSESNDNEIISSSVDNFPIFETVSINYVCESTDLELFNS